jgi:hypothetical protein
MPFYVRSQSVASRVIAGETLIIPVRKGVGDLASIYSLNPVASLIWQAIQQPREKEEIVSVIEQEFAGERAQIEHDIDEFLHEMRAAGLVEPLAKCVIGVPA